MFSATVVLTLSIREAMIVLEGQQKTLGKRVVGSLDLGMYSW
jgi:hypothetical protein